MPNVFETLNERGFIKQTTNAEQVANLLAEEQVTYYVGFESDSLKSACREPCSHNGDGTPAACRP